ncbi:MAG: phage antirepressor KilAC domain-containing protein [Marinobacter sp.]|nr:phage antirepressor KilAC domain-containing protein [Marinobacter sp.]
MPHTAQQPTLSDAAVMLNLGPKKLFRALRSRQVLDKNNLPGSRYTGRGLFTVELKTYTHPALGEKVYAVTHVTDKGLKWLAREFDVEITQAQEPH